MGHAERLEYTNQDNAQEDISATEEITLQDIENMREPIQKIIEQMDLKEAKYGTIICDDASGRIPALIFNEVIGKINNDNHIEKPKLLFIAGQKSTWRENEEWVDGRMVKKISIFKQMKEHISKNLKDPERILIVTDTLNSGDGIYPITRTLEEEGMKYDIASISTLIHPKRDDPEIDKMQFKALEVKLAYHDKNYTKKGEIFTNFSKAVPGIYKSPHLSGVTKIAGNLLSEREKDFNPSYVKKAREDAHILADQLYTWYKELKN
ncbi:MAG: hypothetical protein NTY12_02830 [Candidatus Falkowbacteria bacterium]|nr:hypothetical protein [Candidatus Falkowbacteria bacterium]